MSNERVDSPATGRWSLVALACCSVWLLLQNSLLLVWIWSEELAPLFVVARAIARVTMHLAAELWMLPVAVMLGVALALTSGERRESPGVQEVSHVR